MNTVGIIDADYWEGGNEGHIMIKLYNPMNLHSDPTGHLQAKNGEAIVQGIITTYYTCDEEEKVTEKRKGGMGSTDNKAKK
jgi:dUTPase